MKIEFFPVESRLYDFLEFPALLFHQERYGLKEREEVLAEKGNQDLMAKACHLLLPYEERIEIYYEKGLYGTYDFMEMVTLSYGLSGYTDERAYLEALRALDEKAIRDALGYFVLSDSEEEESFSPERMEKAKAMESSVLLERIKELPMPAAMKWNLYLALENPGAYMAGYCHLMEELLPLFYEIYGPLEKRVMAYGRDLEKKLREEGSGALKRLSFSILDESLLGDERSKLIVSALLQDILLLFQRGGDSYICWGLEVENLLEILRQRREDELNERIRVFKNLGDRTRYEVLRFIAQGQSSTKAIAEALGVSSATISYHLNHLLQAKVIRLMRKENKYAYAIDRDFLKNVLRELEEDISE